MAERAKQTKLLVRGGGTYLQLGGQARGVAYARCQTQCIEVRSADQSAQSADIFFAFIIQLSGWALVAPSCFVLRVPDV